MVLFSAPFLSDDRFKDEVLRVKRGGFTLLRYKTPLNDGELRAYRSAVYSGSSLVGFSTPKFTRIEHAVQNIPFEELEVREYVDGTMVYAYHADGAWRLATRGTPDAETMYRVGTQPPAPLTADLRREHPPTHTIAVHFKNVAFQLDLFAKLEVGVSYVFSFMDPLIFNVHKRSGIYFIGAYRIAGDTAEPYTPPEDPAPRPTLMNYASFAEMNDDVYLHRAGDDFKGVVLRHPPTDTYFKIINPKFSQLHALLPFASINKCALHHLLTSPNTSLGNFLQGFPEYAENVEQIKRNLKAFRERLHSNYRECFITKLKRHADYPPIYREHLYNLHGIYLRRRGDGRRIVAEDVRCYVESLTLDQLTFLL